MNKMLVLVNRLDIESYLPEIREITETHGVEQVYLAKTSLDFSSRIRSIVAPHRLDMVAQISDEAANRYLSIITNTLRGKGIDCKPISAGIPVKKLDNFIKENDIDLVLTSDGRSGLCRWPSRGLIEKGAQSLYEHTFSGDRAELIGETGTKPHVKKMLVMLNHLDIEERLPELRNIILTQGVESVHLASVSSTFSSGAHSMVTIQEQNPVIVYLARISRAFDSRVRSIVAPQKLDTAIRMGDAAANKYLLKIASILSKEGIETMPIDAGTSLEKVEEYIKANNIALVITGDGHSGLLSWPSEHLSTGNIESLYYNVLAEAEAILERRKVKVRHGLRTIYGIVLQFSILFTFWLILSGHFNLKYILTGVASVSLITWLDNDLFSSIFDHEEMADISGPPAVLKFLHFVRYMPWLLYQVVKANFQVAKIVLNPRMPIDPSIIRFNVRTKRKVAQVILANSITLTPGTVTISLDDGSYTVHTLVPELAQGLVEATMQNKVGEIFIEKKEQPPKILRVYSIKDLVQ